MSARTVFTSESVTEGHPDKVADQISDTILDAVLAEDPHGRVACETLLTTGLCVVAGEITTTAHLDVPELARETIVDIGYDDDATGFNGRTCAVLVSLDRQSPEIAAGVDAAVEHRTGAGGEDVAQRPGRGGPGDDVRLRLRRDRGPPAAPDLARAPPQHAARPGAPHRPAHLPAPRRQDPGVRRLRGRSRRSASRPIVVSAQHHDGISQDVIHDDLLDHVIDPVVPKDLDRSELVVHTNPSGAFVFGGPSADTGLTGRKIIVDTYGGMARHGGGAFSGKDPSKVDRSGAYAARWVAKHVVASGAARRCEVRVAYAIGVARPVSVELETVRHGRGGPGEDRRASSPSCSTCGPPRSSTSSSCAGPCTARPPRTGTSAAPSASSPGSRRPKADELRRALGL